MKRARGFTLIELLVVVAIIAVLATIAIQMFGQYSYRARRADAQELLQHIAIAQERFYATNNHYGALTDIGYTSPAISENGYYSVTSVLSNDDQEFTATAAPSGAQQQDACGSLTLDNAGARASTGTASNGTCW